MAYSVRLVSQPDLQNFLNDNNSRGWTLVQMLPATTENQDKVTVVMQHDDPQAETKTA